MRRPILAAAAAFTMLATAFASPAVAHNATFPTQVTINFVDRPGADLFRGRVSSPNANCIENRFVQLRRSVAGPDQAIDSDRSEDDGRWDIDVEGDPAPGRYYVRVAARDIGPAGHNHVCLKATSRVISVAG